MRIVVATEGETEKSIATHFAHCSHFIVFDVENDKIRNIETIENPYFQNHTPGKLPEFIESLGTKVLLVGGIGRKAVVLLEKKNIEVFYGIEGKPEDLVDDYIKGKIETKKNFCDH